MDGAQTLSSSELDSLRAELVAHFSRVRAETEALSAPLSTEDCQIQSMPDASPVKWHLAHTTWFWETFILKPMSAAYDELDPAYDFLFNSYYEAVGPRLARPDRGMMTRPSLADVMTYRTHVTEAACRYFETCGDSAFSGVVHLLKTGLAHEEQHQELILTDIKHALHQNPNKPAAYAAPQDNPRPEAVEQTWSHFDGGVFEVGAGEDGFSFDNEHPRHKVWLDPFALADRPVTNGEVKAFIEDGGYQTASLWLSAGWGRVQEEGWRAPLYWECRDGDWLEFTLHGLQRLDEAAPAAHLSYYEADAIAEWLGPRLPTEAEWERAAVGRTVSPRARNIAAGIHPAPASQANLAGLYGEVWQWTTSSYGPYPGYRRPAGAIGEYNGKFMSGQYVLRGSSCATSAGHARPSYRNFFHAPDRWQFTGVRLAKDL